ncbi:hypothetical protein PMAYCL1PPCAC_26227, partial [Pristionchus mayeri]
RAASVRREQSSITSLSSAASAEAEASTVHEEETREDNNFCTGQTTSECPRCNKMVRGPLEARRLHYDRWHYDRYNSDKSIVKARKVSEVDDWLCSKIGQEEYYPRGCLHCLKNGEKRVFIMRTSLLNHIAK